MLAALGAADVPLERAVDPRGPPYDVTFGLDSGGTSALSLPELTARVGRVFNGRAKFDLHLEIADHGPGGDLDGVLEYDAELFGRGTARRVADGLVAVFRGIAAAPGQRVGSLPVWPVPGMAGGRP